MLPHHLEFNCLTFLKDQFKKTTWPPLLDAEISNIRLLLNCAIEKLFAFDINDEIVEVVMAS